MDKKKKLNIEEIEQMMDRKLTVAEVYANRPHKWIVYTAIVLIIVTLVGWSAADIKFTGLTATGTEVAKGVLHGVFHPDTNLMFGTTNTDVPYLLLQTMAIAVLGTLFGAILAIPFAFLASFNISLSRGICGSMCADIDDTHHTKHSMGADVDTGYRPRRCLRRNNPVNLFHRHDIQDVYHGHRGSGYPHTGEPGCNGCTPFQKIRYGSYPAAHRQLYLHHHISLRYQP